MTARKWHEPLPTFSQTRTARARGQTHVWACASRPRKTNLTDLLTTNHQPLATDLRYEVTPIELLRNTMRSRLTSKSFETPDSQFEFLPRSYNTAKPEAKP